MLCVLGLWALKPQYTNTLERNSWARATPSYSTAAVRASIILFPIRMTLPSLLTATLIDGEFHLYLTFSLSLQRDHSFCFLRWDLLIICTAEDFLAKWWGIEAVSGESVVICRDLCQFYSCIWFCTSCKLKIIVCQFLASLDLLLYWKVFRFVKFHVIDIFQWKKFISLNSILQVYFRGRKLFHSFLELIVWIGCCDKVKCEIGMGCIEILNIVVLLL